MTFISTSLCFPSFLTFLLIISPTQAFTTDLIHLESPQSPYYDRSLTQYERLRNSIRRSISRFDQIETELSSSKNDVETQLKGLIQGEYLMEVSFGTPPVPQLVYADTTTDLIWTQCKPCLACYKQGPPMFDPSKSSTYKLASCDSNTCQTILRDDRYKCTKNNTCGYTEYYENYSSTFGEIATDTITIGTKSFPNLIIGCGNQNRLTIDYPYGSGIVGLNGRYVSLISQFGPSIPKKFSYCLIPFNKDSNSSSKIKFGNSADVTGPGVVSIPLQESLTKNYILKLNEISVGNVKIPFHDNRRHKIIFFKPKGNMVLDSTSAVTRLSTLVYSNLTSALQKVIKGQKVEDPHHNLDLCYVSTNFGADLNIPNITFHFEGADLELKHTNTFLPISDSIVCLYILPARRFKNGHSLGFVAQFDYLVGYDPEQRKVSFKPTDCTKE